MHYLELKTASAAEVVDLESGEQLAWMAYHTVPPTEGDDLEVWIARAAVSYLEEGNGDLYDRDLSIGQHVLAKMLLN